MKFLKLLLLSLAILIAGGCSKKDQQPPSNRDGVSDGSQPPAGQPVAEPVPDEPPKKSRREKYTIQVGSFARLEEADKLAYELRAKNVNHFIERVGQDWRVCVGKYYSLERAERTQNQLIDMGFTKASVIIQ
jgi:cell division septation protein DedD